MANKDWGFKIYCECGSKYYSMNKKETIKCPICEAEYVSEDLNLKSMIASAPKMEPKKKFEDLDSVDEPTEDNDDFISLDDQKDIEDSEENLKSD